MHKTQKWKRVLSLVLTLCMATTSLAPTFVYAAAESPAVTESGVTDVVDPAVPQANVENTPATDTGATDSSSSAESTPTEETEQPVLPPLDDKQPTETPESTVTPPNPEETPAPDVKPEPEKPSDSESATPTPAPDSEVTPNPDATQSPDSTPEPDATPAPDSESVPGETPDPNATPDPDAPEKPDESEVPSENKNEAEGFVPLQVLDPENAVITAEIGEEVTLATKLNRDDILVEYQWQKYQNRIPQKKISYTTQLYDYDEHETTSYRFLIDGITEAEALAENDQRIWPGIELFYAVKAALDDLEADTSKLSIKRGTVNYALEGYSFSAEMVDGKPVVYAQKDDKQAIGKQNEYGQYFFEETAGKTPEVSAAPELAWTDIEGATTPEYTFTVTEADHYADFRLKVTIRDEKYLEKVVKILESQDVVLTEEQKAKDQILFSIVMSIKSATPTEYETMEMDAPPMLMDVFSGFVSESKNGGPDISDDNQWIINIDSNYEYITEDTYKRAKAWLDAGEITQKQMNRFWTYLLPASKIWKANVLDKNGKPIGGEDNFRTYTGFSLTDGDKVEIASEWYGKTVYFRKHGSDGIGTAIPIPAYTEVTLNGDVYVEASSGTKYKKAVTFLNAWVKDTQTEEVPSGSVYKNFLEYVSPSGWFKDRTHVTTYTVPVEEFNADPARYMVDAEGNYRMDSVGWGVCVYEEPDISGKAYWVLKDFIANGYGFLTGHDTLYAYAGSYYDAYETTLDESTIDPNDGTTWYYDLNTYQPTAHDQNGNTAGGEHRGGHFYTNQLMGSNKGSVLDPWMEAGDAPSLILSSGGANRGEGKNIMFADNNLIITENRFSSEKAASNPRYRTPTNYPYGFPEGLAMPASYTHTNSQIAFGPIWVKYAGPSWHLIDEDFRWAPLSDVPNGQKPPDDKWTWSMHTEEQTFKDANGRVGTNNFYLTGHGNYLMNQVGHLPDNSTTYDEARLFVNSVMYVSQRKQCEICAANQRGQQTAHFVRRVSAANWNDVITDLQNGGSYWYPIDGCYMLTENVQLPDDWKPIEGFKGHWNSDVYMVKLGANQEPLLENRVAQGEKGWNLGTDQTIGTDNVFNPGMIRTTGVARVLGDLNDLFSDGTTAKNYNGYTVKIKGMDNQKYFPGQEALKEFTCTVNSDNKYVISNLPCIYEKGHDDVPPTGKLVARVYDEKGREVTEYGPIRVDVEKEFWDNDMTTPLYLGSFSSKPVDDYTTYESGQAVFFAEASSAGEIEIMPWQYSADGGQTWQDVPEEWDITTKPAVIPPSNVAGGSDDYAAYTTLILNDVNPAWDQYHFRAVFRSKDYGGWNTYRYHVRNRLTSNEPFEGSVEKLIMREGRSGQLFVKPWPAYAEQGPNQTVSEASDAIFKAYGYALDGGTPISVRWQYSTPGYVSSSGEEVFDWHYIDEDQEFAGATVSVGQPVRKHVPALDYALGTIAPQTDFPMFHKQADFHGVETTLTIKKADIRQTGTHFRAEFTAVSQFGTSATWYSNIADDYDGVWTTSTGGFGNYSQNEKLANSNILTVIPPDLQVVTRKSAEFADGAGYQDLMTPDEYGQTVLLKNAASTVADGRAAYQADVYYRPMDGHPTHEWQFMLYKDRSAKTLTQVSLEQLGHRGVKVEEVSTKPVPAEKNGESGWMKYTTTLYLSNIPISMYNPEQELKFYFRCLAKMDYATVKEEKHLAANDKWGGLTMDYNVDIKHNGVMEYDNTNNVNGLTVTDQGSLSAATKGQPYSDWYFPKLALKHPQAHHLNTAIIEMKPTAGSKLADGDTLLVNESAIKALGITVQKKEAHRLELISTTKDTVEKDTWEKALREYVGFRTYDSIQTNNTDFLQGTGAEIVWKVDEARITGVEIDPNSGHAYKLLTFANPTDWNTAKQKAMEYNHDLQMAGKIVEINSAAENELVRQVAKGHNIWLGAHKNGNNFFWESGSVVTNPNWAAGAEKGNSNLFMKPDGKWNSGPIHKEVGHKGEKDCGGSTRVEARGNGKIDRFTSSVHVPNGTYKVRIRGDGDTNDGPGGDVFVYFLDGVWGPEVPGTRGYLIKDNRTIDITTNVNYPKGADIVARVNQNAVAYNYWGNYRISSIYAWYNDTKTVTENPVDAVVVEYEMDSLALARTDHSASDDAVIGTSGEIPPTSSTLYLTTNIVGDTKIYDGRPIYPSKFEVSARSNPAGLENMIPQAYDLRKLFTVHYTASIPYNHADYTQHDVNGERYRQTDAINATTYHAVVTINDDAVTKLLTDIPTLGTPDSLQIVFDTRNSVTECNMIIFPRPIDISSYHNNKEYDGTNSGIIAGITIDPPTDANSGIVNNDPVYLTTTELLGTYIKDDGSPAIHNSDTNNGGKEYTMLKDTTAQIGIRHDYTSDPHWNYVLRNKKFTGAITPRPLVVHSTYIEPEHPLDGTGRNIKCYDGTTKAVVKDVTPKGEQNIFIDHARGGIGIVKGDHIGLDKNEYPGVYATKDANEKVYNLQGHEVTDGTGLPPKEDRLLHLTENVITLDAYPELTGNDKYQDYKIVDYRFSGAIYRARLEVKAQDYPYLYGSEFKGDRLPGQAPAAGDVGHPRPYDMTYQMNKGKTPGSWMSVDGLVKGDVLNLDDKFSMEYHDPVDDSVKTFDNTTPVGTYRLSIRGLNEGNYPVLANYITSIKNGSVNVVPREIVIRPEDIERSVEQDKEPLQTFAHFEMMQDDGQTFAAIGNDRDKDYSELLLANSDTVASVILLANGQPLVKPAAYAISTNANQETYFKNVSAIPFWTTWHPGAPVKYADVQSNPIPQPCEWCEHYYGYDVIPGHDHFDTAHWTIDGYRLKVNEDPAFGADTTLKIATVKNMNGEDVQNYVLRYEDAQLKLHPKQRVQLEATVPMYVCMYGFSETGDVVTPDDYGIRNYSNVPIQVENINVSNDGWNVVNKPQHELQRDEISMKMHRTQLQTGNNKLAGPGMPGLPVGVMVPDWVVGRDDTTNGIGVWSMIPIEAYIAGDNQNAIGESYVTHVTYTVGEYGLSLPSIPGVTLPENINGKPVFPMDDTVSNP